LYSNLDSLRPHKHFRDEKEEEKFLMYWKNLEQTREKKEK